MSDVFHNGARVGTIKMLSSDEALNKFNAQRRQIYRRNPELYPGDAVVSGSPYQYYVPFSPR